MGIAFRPGWLQIGGRPGDRFAAITDDIHATVT